MIAYDLREETAWITLENSSSRNALDAQAHEALADAVARAADEAQVTVVTGTGDAFCAGSDVVEIVDATTAEEAAEIAATIYRLHRTIERADVPVVAAVNGIAYGGGCELVAACDLAVAVESATFALPETRLGLTPGYALDRVGTLAGKKRVMELALIGEPINAETALEWGLVNRVVPDSELQETVAAFIEPISWAPKRATAVTKRYVTDAIEQPGERGTAIARLAYLLASPETRDAITDFVGGKSG